MSYTIAGKTCEIRLEEKDFPCPFRGVKAGDKLLIKRGIWEGKVLNAVIKTENVQKHERFIYCNLAKRQLA